MAIILSIESSCDDTSVAICENGKILSNVIASQKVHEEWGGVVPELASRDHLKNIIPTVALALEKSGKTLPEIDAVAFTKGPGLIGSLMVGVSFAKALALALGKPLIDVHHMQAHVMANCIEHNITLPFLCLTVSGGHTQLVLVHDFNHLEIIGETIDDAAGEAFDKTAKIIGLPYPGGPMIDQLAKTGNPLAFKFPEPKTLGLNFSFSGLKTSVLYFVRDQLKINDQFIEQNRTDLAASIQKTIVDILLKKVKQAALTYGVKSIALAGGVSANSELRKRFQELANQQNWMAYVPSFEYCTDNAAMIAMAAYHKYLNNEFCNQETEATARYEM